MSTPQALSPPGSGWRPRMVPAQRDAWEQRLAHSAEAVQQAVAALEDDIEAALHDGCHLTWIAEVAEVHFEVIRRIRDKGTARSWRHPQKRQLAPRRTRRPDITARRDTGDFDGDH